jgi:hypothetical protein
MEWVFGTLALAAYLGWYGRHRRVATHEMTTLNRDGYMVWNGTSKDTSLLILGSDYVFLDYEYTIRGCSLSTWHRDVTSGQRYWNTQYPTYTLIHYKYSGDMVSLVPGSHNDFPYAFQRPADVVGAADTMVLFNADMLHAGMPNTAGADRHVVQYKLAHRDDLANLAHLQGIHTTKDGRGQSMLHPCLESTLRFLSYHGAFMINVFAPRFMMRSYDDGFAKWIQQWIPVRFYNNEPLTS